MLRGRRKFRLKPANMVAFKLSVFESRRISFLKIFLVSIHIIIGSIMKLITVAIALINSAYYLKVMSADNI